MPERPDVVPFFATNPAPGAVIEPVSAEIESGFSTGERPPAQWFNWLFSRTGQWVEFLRSASLGNFAREPFGVAAFGSGTPVGSVDVDTSEGATPIFRYVLGASDGGGFFTLRVSHAGASYIVRTPQDGGGQLIGTAESILWSGTRWLLAGNAAIWYTTPSGVAGSAIDSNANNWTNATVPGGTGNITSMVVGPSAATLAAAGFTPTGLLYSINSGTTWLHATLSVAAVGNFTDVCWTGVAFVAITDQGEIYRATSAAGVWTLVQTLPAATRKLEPGSGGFVLAYVSGSGTVVNWYVSTDNGSTWALQAGPPTLTNIKRIRFRAKSWVMAATDAPYIATSNLAGTNDWVRIPVELVETTAAEAYEILYAAGRYIGVGNDFVYAGLRAEDVSPTTYVPAAVPAPLYDAAFLRSDAIDPARAQLDHDYLGWDFPDKIWQGTPPGKWIRRVGTAIDYTATTADVVIGVTNTAAVRTITLPALVLAINRRFEVIDESGGAAGNPIVIAPAGGATINGGASVTIPINFGRREIHSPDGVNWIASNAY